MFLLCVLCVKKSLHPHFPLRYRVSTPDIGGMEHRNFLKRLLILFLLFAGNAKGAAQTNLMGWGDNRYGQLGVGAFDTAAPYSRSAPTAVSGIPNITALADGFYHSVALAADGTVWTWGYNDYGELGVGAFDVVAPYGRNAPTQIPHFTGVIAVAAGTNHSLALKSDGSVWAWGWNIFGQLGDGSGVNQNAPVKINGLTNVIAIAAGGVHSLALLADGSIMAWGGNSYGELGDGTTTNRATPLLVWSGTAIACGQYHSLAKHTSGRIYAWGSNANGQLGDGTTTSRQTPTPVPGLAGTAFFTAGAFSSFAIENDGTVWGWGWNAYGQIGDGTTTDRLVPARTKNLTNAIAIASGQAHCLALKADGTVWTWGWNAYGQAGSGAFATVAPFGNTTPQQVLSITGANGIAGGGNHAHALFSSIPPVSVSGLITLDGPAVPYLPHTLNFQFRPVGGGGSFLRSAALNPDGSFNVSQVPPNKYSVWVKSAKWLSNVFTADCSGGAVNGVAVELAAGDANNDNSVDSSDFGIFIGTFGDTYDIHSTAHTDDMACDFNEDGSVDSSDFGLLIGSYGQTGVN